MIYLHYALLTCSIEDALKDSLSLRGPRGFRCCGAEAPLGSLRKSVFMTVMCSLTRSYWRCIRLANINLSTSLSESICNLSHKKTGISSMGYFFVCFDHKFSPSVIWLIGTSSFFNPEIPTMASQNLYHTKYVCYVCFAEVLHPWGGVVAVWSLAEEKEPWNVAGGRDARMSGMGEVPLRLAQ